MCLMCGLTLKGNGCSGLFYVPWCFDCMYVYERQNWNCELRTAMLVLRLEPGFSEKADGLTTELSLRPQQTHLNFVC